MNHWAVLLNYIYGEEDSRQTTFYVHIYLTAHTKNLLRRSVGRRRRYIYIYLTLLFNINKRNGYNTYKLRETWNDFDFAMKIKLKIFVTNEITVSLRINKFLVSNTSFFFINSYVLYHGMSLYIKSTWIHRLCSIFFLKKIASRLEKVIFSDK